MDESAFKRVKDIIDGLDLPPEDKAVATAILALGGNPVGFLLEASAIYETLKAEKEHPRLPMPEDYTETERILHEMLTENTGAHPLDSGFIYGRHWERNREVEDFRKLPVVDVEVWENGEVLISVNIFHYLRFFLERDRTSEILEAMLYNLAERPEYRDMSWLGVMEEFGDYLASLGWNVSRTWNSYNWENLLSQGIQGINIWRERGEEKEEYIILQIHNGCDIRGGYTKPRVFKLVEEEDGDFVIWMDEIGAFCECTHVYSDDCGYHWYSVDQEGFPEHWKPKPKSDDPEDKEYTLVCERCGKEVRFHHMIEDYL